MKFTKLKGLTITDVVVEEHQIYDDDPSIVLCCSNGRKYRIEGGSEEGTDESSGEQRVKLTMTCLADRGQIKDKHLKVDVTNVVNDANFVNIHVNGKQIHTVDSLMSIISKMEYDDKFRIFRKLGTLI